MTQNAINNTASILNVDNLQLDGNTMSATDVNGNVVIVPNGTGVVQIASLGNAANTQHIVIESTGEVTMPLQPAFLATHSVAQTAVTGDGTMVTLDFTTVVFDRNSDYDGTNTFVASVSGIYRFNFNIYASGVIAANTSGYMQLTTSNRNYQTNVYNYGAVTSATGVCIYGACFLADMDAGDSASIVCTISNNGAKNVSFPASVTQTFFAGELVC